MESYPSDKKKGFDYGDEKMKWSRFKEIIDSELEKRGNGDPEIDIILIDGGCDYLEKYHSFSVHNGKLCIE